MDVEKGYLFKLCIHPDLKSPYKSSYKRSIEGSVIEIKDIES